MHSTSLPSGFEGPYLLGIPGRQREIPCADIPSASATYLTLSQRRRTRMPIATLRRPEGESSLFVSPNGTIWREDPARADWQPGETPVYDPRTRPEPLPDHLNFSFRDWLRQRTELPRSAHGWTPLSRLHADYVEWCTANDVPAEYVIGTDQFSGRLRAHHDRAPEKRKVQDGLREAYELCFPRFLLRPIRV